MRYRRFGRSNLLFSVFSLGTMRYLGSQECAVETVVKAVQMGVNHLETARGYGKSEEFLRVALGSLPVSREKLFLTTKIPPVSDADEMERLIDESLRRLGVSYVDCLALHGINTWEHLQLVKAGEGCLRGVERARKDGRVRFLGFSTHGPVEVILAAINTDLFDFVNLHYYYFFQRNEPAVRLAWEKDMGVFIISPADKGGRLYTPPASLKALCEPFSALELNYRFLLSDERVTTLSLGAGKSEELDWPLSVADRVDALSEEEKKVFLRLENQAARVLGEDKCSQCYECLPCPEKINIPEVLRLRNLAVGYEMVDFAKYRYGMFENAGHWFWGMKGGRCTECGDCLPRCPEGLDIASLVKDADRRLKGEGGRRLWG